MYVFRQPYGDLAHAMSWMCAHIHMHTCVCVCVCVCVCTGHHDHVQDMCTAADSPLVASGGKDGQVLLYVFMRVYIHTCMHACIQTYIHIHIHMHIHIHIHIHMHTHQVMLWDMRQQHCRMCSLTIECVL